MTWTEIITSSEGAGAVPSPCGGHTTCEWSGRLYVFGGGSGTHFVSELHVFDTLQSRWQLTRVAGTAPSPRSRHTAAFVGARMFVLFGGDDTRVYDDVHVFDAERNAWQELATSGARPGARWGHTMCVLPDRRRLLVFGGHDGESMLNDLHILDTDTLVWSRLHASTADALVPPPRAGHTASMVNRAMIVFGGGDGDSLLNDCWSLTLDGGDTTPHWHRLVASGAPPSARCAHTSVTLPPRSADAFSARVLVFGGGDGARRFKDVYELDVHRAVDGGGHSPATRSAAAAAAAPAPPVADGAAAAAAAADSSNSAQSGRARHSDSIRRLTDVDAAAAAAATRTLRSFLERVNLSHLHDTFAAQDIDVAVLPSLTEAHLRELGVATVGARLRIIAAAKEIDTNTATTKTTTKRNETTTSNDHHALLEAARALDSAVRLLSTSSTALGRLLHADASAAIATTTTTTPSSSSSSSSTKAKQQQMSPRKNGANRHQLQYAQGHG